MSADAPPTPPTGLMPRFTLLIQAMVRGLGQGLDQRRGWGDREPLARLGVLALPLWKYLSRTLLRLAALHARFAAGKLPAAPRRSTARRPAGERPRHERPPPVIPRGPVFLEYYMAHFAHHLQVLLDDPEMRALLAAGPQAGRLLRPLWRKLTPDPLPEVLRLPPRPRRPKPPRAKQPAVARAKAGPRVARSHRARRMALSRVAVVGPRAGGRAAGFPAALAAAAFSDLTPGGACACQN